MAKKKWNQLPHNEQVSAVLSAVRRGRSTKSLANYLGAPPYDVESILVSERNNGAVRCSNKVWYRTDQPLTPKQPRPPRLTVKQELFLKRQGNLF